MNPSRREFLGLASFLGIQSNPITRLLSSSIKPDSDTQLENPYLNLEFYAPTQNEVSFANLEVIQGKIPEEISGTYFRNGPNPPYPTQPHHWFDGDGMIHRIEVNQGRARYSNRYVKTSAWTTEQTWGKVYPGLHEAAKPQFAARVALSSAVFHSPVKDTSNTDVIFFRNQLISLWWLSGAPYALDPNSLDPQGVAKFDGYHGNACAHARIDPRTGDLFFLDFSKFFSWVRVVAISSNGKKKWIRKFKLPSPRIYHDILFTENYVILMDFPVGIQLQGEVGIGLNRNYPSRIILIPRDGVSKEIVIETDPCYVLHGLNAFEKDGAILLSVLKYDDPFRKNSNTETSIIPYVGALRVDTHPVLWILDLQRKSLSEHFLDHENTEFPRINDEYLGIESKYSYHPRIAPEKTVKFNGLIKYDWESGKKLTLDLPQNHFGEEFVFIPRNTRESEDDGWIATLVHEKSESDDLQNYRHYFDIYDAVTLNPTPVARIHIPYHVPAGFHCKWVPQSH